LLQSAITSVRNGRLEPIPVSKTRDEIEYLGESFNSMIQTLAESKHEITQHQTMLEHRIQQRTEELKAALLDAHAASEAKSQLLSDISREMRTPIDDIIGRIDVTLAGSFHGEQRENLQTTQRLAYSLRHLLNEILDLSKVEAGDKVLNKTAFNLHATLVDSVNSMEPMAARKGIALESSISPDIPAQAVGDSLRVRQIVSGLLSNAMKSAESGTVSFAAESAVDESRNITLRLCLRNSAQRDDRAGLEHAITKKLIELHAGEIRVKNDGACTEVQVTLRRGLTREPSGAAPEAPVRSAISALARSVSERPRVLVVEDNLVNQKVVLAVLGKRGFELDVANDGREALRKLEASDFDVVLMDVQMPVLDGLETTRIIRQDPRWRELPIIAMTAHAMNGDRERCLQAGMSAYISKPVHPSDLVDLVQQFLRTQV
jgi:CheY-like chemotaxis protein